ncbi:MAG: lysophospholipid acyltransferase family protein [Spirochaetia bacterium]|nr:lysophospholipid acyltransferase family protein [Spirochaetia bacterium]
MLWILKFAQWFISKLPIGMMYSISYFITKCFFFFWKEKRDNVHNNFRVILEKKYGRPPTNEELETVVNDNYKNYAKFNVEFLYIHKLVRISSLPPMHNIERIDEALASGKGLIICTLHFSNWDVAGAIISGHYRGKRDIWAVADDLGGGYSDFIQESRARYGINIILPNRNLKQAYECLRSGGILNVLVDRPMPANDKSAVEVEFFDRKIWVASTAARFAVKSGASIIVGCAKRNGNNFYGDAGPVLKYELSGDRDRDVRTVTQVIMSEAERIIMENPEQWYMFRKIF